MARGSWRESTSPDHRNIRVYLFVELMSLWPEWSRRAPLPVQGPGVTGVLLPHGHTPPDPDRPAQSRTDVDESRSLLKHLSPSTLPLLRRDFMLMDVAVARASPLLVAGRGFRPAHVQSGLLKNLQAASLVLHHNFPSVYAFKWNPVISR